MSGAALEGANRGCWRTQLQPGVQGWVSALHQWHGRSQSCPLVGHGGVGSFAPCGTAGGAEVWLWGATAPLLQPSHAWERGWGRTSRGDEGTRAMPARPWLPALRTTSSPPKPCLPAPFPPRCLPPSPPPPGPPAPHPNPAPSTLPTPLPSPLPATPPGTVPPRQPERCQRKPRVTQAGGEVAGHPGGLGAAGSTGVFAVPCSKSSLFSSSSRFKLPLLSLGIKSLEMAAGCPAALGSEGSGWRGCARLGGRVSPGRGRVREGHSPPLHHHRRFGVQRGRKPTCGDGSWSGLSMHQPCGCCISTQLPNPIQDKRTPPK